MKEIQLFRYDVWRRQTAVVEIHRSASDIFTSRRIEVIPNSPPLNPREKFPHTKIQKRHVIKFIKEVLGAKHKVYCHTKDGRTRFLGYSKVKINTNDMEKSYSDPVPNLNLEF